VALTLIHSLPAVLVGLTLPARRVHRDSGVELLGSAARSRGRRGGAVRDLFYIGGSAGSAIPGLLWPTPRAAVRRSDYRSADADDFAGRSIFWKRSEAVSAAL